MLYLHFGSVMVSICNRKLHQTFARLRSCFSPVSTLEVVCDAGACTDGTCYKTDPNDDDALCICNPGFHKPDLTCEGEQILTTNICCIYGSNYLMLLTAWQVNNMFFPPNTTTNNNNNRVSLLQIWIRLLARV